MTAARSSSLPIPDAVIAWLGADERVLGAAQVRSGLHPDDASWVRWVVVCRYDAKAAVIAELRGRLGPSFDLDTARVVIDDDGLHGVTAERVRLDVDVVAKSDLRPDPRGEGATVLLDRNGVVAQWVRWSANRPPREPDEGSAAARRALDADRFLRSLTDETRVDDATRFEIARTVAGLDPLHAADAALQRDAAALRARRPVPDAGVLSFAGADHRTAFDAFLAVADGEGFRGDRTLFERARDQLAVRPGCAVAFDSGWCLPTFDAVDVRFVLGPPGGGCKVPLVPGVAVGVAVTAADELAFWAAPTVRDVGGRLPSVFDDGTRTVLARDAGRDAFFAALDLAVATAADDVPRALAHARGAARETLDDLEAALLTTHLPRSHRERVVRRLEDRDSVTRFDLALALVRCAEHEAPLTSAKLLSAAGRVLTAATPTDLGAC